MDKIKSVLHTGTGLIATAAVILFLIVLFSLVIGGIPRKPSAEPLAGQTATDTPSEVYPPPFDQNPPTPVWTDTALPLPTSTVEEQPSFPDTPPSPAGRAATLFKGDVWMVEPGTEPQQLTNFGDVAGIFGWNPDGTRLLFGRGRIAHGGYESDTTELWVVDLPNNQYVQLTSGSPASSAAWSPQGDRIAYSEVGQLITIVDLAGNKLYQQDHVLLGFSWSPDGTLLAVSYYTPEMDLGGVVFAVLAIWQFEQGVLQVVDDKWEVVDVRPVWSMDGQHILFQRYNYGQEKYKIEGLLVFDLADRAIRHIELDAGSAIYLSRSPRMDLVVVEIFRELNHSELFTIDFDGNYTAIGQGANPAWSADGITLVYRANDRSLQCTSLDAVATVQAMIGGDHYAVSLYIHPEFYFKPGG